MSRKWIVPVVAAAAAGAIAFAVTRQACRRSETSLDRLEDMSFLTRKLRLSPAQADEIKGLQTALRAKLNDCCERHCAARARLGEALSSETNGRARAEVSVAEMCRAYEESERATLDHIQRVRAVLTTEQRKRFDEMINQYVCRTDDTCAGTKVSPLRPARD